MAKKLVPNLLSGLLILLMLVSWFLNFGILRWVLTFLLFPLISSVLFFIGNFLTTRLRKLPRYALLLHILSYPVFLLPHLLLPDGDDAGNFYAFFGLIRGVEESAVLNVLSFALFFLSGLIGVGQIVLFFLLRKK